AALLNEETAIKAIIMIGVDNVFSLMAVFFGCKRISTVSIGKRCSVTATLLRLVTVTRYLSKRMRDRLNFNLINIIKSTLTSL
ncbi:hypothetical protein, partial [Vibrio azureus]|uniref:hypothetical protein n=1 Tax=Vibrio azureus TaxID=512649 RepID=UPI0005865B99